MKHPRRAAPNVAPLVPARPSRRFWIAAALAGILLAGGLSYALLFHDRDAAPPGMVWVPAGWFSMGSDRFPDAQPIHRVWVDGFWMDQYEVTNEQFAEFVEDTGYKTVAEQPVPEKLRKQALPKYRHLKTFSMVFTAPKTCSEDCPVCDQGWDLVEDACWKRPRGPGSSIKGLEKHPVVHIAWNDAVAYCKWAGKRLPTEAEWERAARGGLDRKPFYWGDKLNPDGQWMANTWQGKFPCENTEKDGYVGTSPVGSYPPNGYGLYDMAGNAWEWCSDWYQPGYQVQRGETRRNPTGPIQSLDTHGNAEDKRVMRGGSFLCADTYCQRYRAGGRQQGEPYTGQSHTGFRCVLSPKK